MFIPFDTPARRRRLGDNEIAVHNKKDNYTFTVNQTLSDEVERLGLTHFAAGRDNITGEIGFLFSRDKGLMTRRSGLNGSARGNITVASKIWTQMVSDALSETRADFVVYLSRNLSDSEDMLFYRVMGVR